MGSAEMLEERAAVTTFPVEFSEEVSFSNSFASHCCQGKQDESQHL